MIDIKKYTTDDKVRTCLSTLVEPGDTSAQEICHKNCIVYAERTSRIDDDVNNKRYSIHRKLVDLEFVASGKLSLTDGDVLNMSDLNKKYICMLIEHGIPETSDNNKKYIKDLLSKCIENINFIRPPRRNESENLLLNETVSAAIDSFVDQYSNRDYDLIRITKTMRKELLDTRKKWKFSGKLNENIRNGSKNVAFSIHDEMNISKLSLKELLSDVRTKADFTRYLSEKLLISFSKSNQHPVVSYDTHTKETCLDKS